jgi:cell division protein FtsI (penicillin-binding protein 3)
MPNAPREPREPRRRQPPEPTVVPFRSGAAGRGGNAGRSAPGGPGTAAPGDTARGSSARASSARGSSARGGGARGDTARAGTGGLAEARRYSPRGRTLREEASRDPFRPALELVSVPRSRGGAPKARNGTPPSKAAATRAAPTRAAPTKAAPARRTPAKAAPTKAAPARGSAAKATPLRVVPPKPGAAVRTSGAGPRRRAATAPKAVPTRRQPVRKPRPKVRPAQAVRRLRLGTVLLLLMFLVVGGRLVALQLTDARQVALTGLADRLAHETLFAPRGTIYDRGHNVLAQSLEARYVFADPSLIKPAEVNQVADALRPLLGIPSSELVPKLSRQKRTDGRKDEFEYLARGVSITTGDAITALNLPGIGVGRDEVRSEPGNDLAANLIGYTGSEGTGLVGIEAGYDTLLAGKDGKRTFEVGNGDLVQIPGGYEEETAPRPGSSIELTIDRDLQYEVQQILAQKMAKAGATFAAAVVLDTHTFEVLAQASYPTYSAANPGQSTAAQRVDAASQIVVDPGSSHKVVTLGAALDTGAVDPNSTVTICPTINKAGMVYHDDHPFPCGTHITLPGILAYSSNVGTITVASHLPAPTLVNYQRAFGLGRATGEGLPGEAPGMVLPAKDWHGTSYGSIPIGLGVSVTPLQLAAVYATVANGGMYLPPRLIKSTIGPDGAVHTEPAPEQRRVLSEQTAAILRQDLEAVVTSPHATGRAAAIGGYRIAGKTGTGQFVKDGHYAPGNVASFIGMAPADAPRYVVAVVAYVPHGSGGTVAAPAFQQMMQFALRLYRVPPTGTRPPKFVTTR